MAVLMDWWIGAAPGGDTDGDAGAPENCLVALID
jgi:hypothetical protein